MTSQGTPPGDKNVADAQQPVDNTLTVYGGNENVAAQVQLGTTGVAMAETTKGKADEKKEKKSDEKKKKEDEKKNKKAEEKEEKPEETKEKKGGKIPKKK